MSTEIEEEQKRELHKLLREFNGNSGMAGFVCGRPVEMMPEAEQERMFSGFCTPENVNILKISREKLALALTLRLDETENDKLQRAIPVLDALVSSISAYCDKEITRAELKARVRTTLKRPVPETREGLLDVVSELVDTINFLSGQELVSKDDWEQMIDCAQMFDAFERFQRVCEVLEKDGAFHSEAIARTKEVTVSHQPRLEVFFKGERNIDDVQRLFKEIENELGEIWQS